MGLLTVLSNMELDTSSYLFNAFSNTRKVQISKHTLYLFLTEYDVIDFQEIYSHYTSVEISYINYKRVIPEDDLEDFSEYVIYTYTAALDILLTSDDNVLTLLHHLHLCSKKHKRHIVSLNKLLD